MPKPMRTVSFKLPPGLDELLTELAQQRNTSRSSLVREALVAFTARPTRSVTSITDQVAGTIEGPPDLSIHPRHLSGYGR